MCVCVRACAHLDQPGLTHAFQGDHFKDVLSYRDEQKEKKKGFLSGDFKRRDEYTKTVRVEQYREQLKVGAERSIGRSINQCTRVPTTHSCPLCPQQEKKNDKIALAMGDKAMAHESSGKSATVGDETLCSQSKDTAGPVRL